jgi:hypothetical protein
LRVEGGERVNVGKGVGGGRRCTYFGEEDGRGPPNARACSRDEDGLAWMWTL